MLKTSLVLLLLFAQTAEKFQIMGTLEGLPRSSRWGRARLESVDGRMQEWTNVEPDGKFRFRDLRDGLYYLTVKMIGYDEVRRTVAVNRTLANKKRQIAVTYSVTAEMRNAVEANTVSLRRLQIPTQALREYRSALRQKDRTKARQHLQKALEIAPDFEEALNDLGTFFHRDQEFVKSIELFERSLKINPDSFSARVNLAGSLLSDGQTDRALQENEKALTARPNDALANAQQGIILFNLKLDEEAVIYLQKVKDLDPFSPTMPELFLAEIHIRHGRRFQAVDELEDFLKHHPDHPGSGQIQERLQELRNRGR